MVNLQSLFEIIAKIDAMEGRNGGKEWGKRYFESKNNYLARFPQHELHAGARILVTVVAPRITLIIDKR